MTSLASATSTDDVRLRDVHDSDLPIFFEQQRDPEANHMAAFTAKDPEDRAAFMQHWQNIMSNPDNIKQTIVVDEQVAGNIGSFEMFGDRDVGYWLGKEYWGRGIATRALSAFLLVERTRPLHARAVHDNSASLRVLERCGFVRVGSDTGFSNARGVDVEEVVLQLA